MSEVTSGRISFPAHLELLRLFLTCRDELVGRIQDVLNARRRPDHYLRNRSVISADIENCFFTLADLTSEQRQLRGQLEEAHRSSGFRPRQVPGLYNDLIHPAEMTLRAFYCWQQTRWPGRNGRIHYAHTVFNLFVLRSLILLSMRLWDTESGDHDQRLRQIQAVLDDLWNGSPGDQPVLVRDARWLIPLAQSPTTDELEAYFDVAEHVAEMPGEDNRTEIQKAHVRMLGGHLTSQIRLYCVQDDLSLDEHSVVLRTRTSNALDFALLIQGLVPLLEAYRKTVQHNDSQRRRELAGAVLQGISPDPELFLSQTELLGAYSMIEYLFATTDQAGSAEYTAQGQRHVRLLKAYETHIPRAAEFLLEDCRHCRPVEGAYSPFGAIFGTPSNLTELMASKTLTRDTTTAYSLEDVFTNGDTGSDKLAWVNGWRKLPHIDAETQKQYQYPAAFAREVFDRIERSLSKFVAEGAANDTHQFGHLILKPEDDRPADAERALPVGLPARYILSSDQQAVDAGEATFCEQTQLLRERLEGHFVVSYETSGGWVGIRKDILTEILAAGHDTNLAGLPPGPSGVLRLTCRRLIADQTR